MKFRPTCLPSHIILQSDTYLNHCETSPVAAPRPSASTHSVRESIQLTWIDSRACEHSSRSHSSCGLTCLHFASGIISAISKSSRSKVRCIRDKTLKKDGRKAYPEVAPHCPISSYIRRIQRKSVVISASGRRGGAIASSDLAGVVHTDEVT
jgi:hypothetical protein